MTERRCKTCGAVLVRLPKHSRAQWEAKRYCDRRCAAQRLIVERYCACGCGAMVLSGRKYVEGHRPLKLMSNGYRRIYRPGHPLADPTGMVLEHRAVVHDAGVAIPPGHHVHHRNGVKTDNRIGNLEVLPASEHHRQHAREAGYIVNQFGRYPLRGTRVCERCGVAFKPWTSDGRYCSRSCANQRALEESA